MRTRFLLALLAVAVGVSLFAPGARSAPPVPQWEPALPPELLERLSWSDDPAPLASRLGLRTLNGRPVAERRRRCCCAGCPRPCGAGSRSRRGTSP